MKCGPPNTLSMSLLKEDTMGSVKKGLDGSDGERLLPGPAVTDGSLRLHEALSCDRS